MTALFGLLFSSFSALAYDCKIDGIYYDLNTTDKTASVTKGIYRGIYSGNIIIPETITYSNTTYSVTSIGEDAFSYCPEQTEKAPLRMEATELGMVTDVSPGQ